METRVAKEADLDRIVEVLTGAFEEDPVWGWAFPDGEGLAAWWRFFAGSALRYPWVWIAGDFAAVAVWIPPGGIELTPEEEARIEPLLTDLLGPRAPEVIELVRSFDSSHPHERPHYYLSLLGTHPSQRGRGIGMALLADNLATIDTERAPAYLESSNPANIPRYEAQGFLKSGEFSLPDKSSTLTTMWRDAR